MSRIQTIALAICILLATGNYPAAAQEIDYATQIEPLLQKHCAGCHNENDMEGEFSLHSFEALMSGGDSGEAIVRGDRRSSLMYMMMSGEVLPEMPPGDQTQLTEEQIELVGRWIDEGAKGSDISSPVVEFPRLESVEDIEPAITGADWSSKNLIAVARYGMVLLKEPGGTSVRELNGFSGKVNSVRFSPDGQKIVVGSGVTGVHGEATAWTMEALESPAEFRDHNDILYSAVLSPDGQLLATAGYDQTIMIRDFGSGEVLQELNGHNDAIYDLDFSPDSTTLISASGDQTIKVWDVRTGTRLDTLGQPLNEQFVCRFSPDGMLIAGAGRDNRIRIWRFTSRGVTSINPLVHSRFAHEGSIVALEFSPDGRWLVSSAEDRTIKVWDTSAFRQQATFENQSDVCSAIAISPDSSQIFVGRLDGTSSLLDLPVRLEVAGGASEVSEIGVEEMAESGEPVRLDEVEPNDLADEANNVQLPALISGVIYGDNRQDADLYSFSAIAGEMLVLEVKAARDKSPLDSKIEVLDADGTPVPRVVLRAVRDSYFTFRGKDSNNSNDFRVHNWEEMGLNDYLYANGEVVKLFLYPRGPDSGFKVYPGYGKRHSYFGTTALAHPLHEPCYVVRPYPVGTAFQPNGLPVFRLNFENDDDPLRKFGSDSRLFFTAPDDGNYIVRVTDVRGFGGKDYTYDLTIRPPVPGFSVKLNHTKDLRKGSGQEFSLTADRIDGFGGPIEVVIENVPESLAVTTPLLIEAGHNQAFGTMHIAAGAETPTAEQLAAISLTATAVVGGEQVSRDVKGFGEMVFHEQPRIQLRVITLDAETQRLFDTEFHERVVLEVVAGQRVEAKVVANRIGHENRISFGNEDSGRNLPHGVYVDDIGLNGLMITKGNDEQTFFIKAEPWVEPTTRTFHVRANDVDGEASLPVEVRVLPRK